MAPDVKPRQQYEQKADKTAAQVSDSSSGSSKPPRPIMGNPRKNASINLRGSPRVNKDSSAEETSNASGNSSRSSDPPPAPMCTSIIPKTTTLTQSSELRQAFNKKQFVLPRQPWEDWQELSVILNGIPKTWGTLDIYNILVHHQTCPARIELRSENRRPGTAKVFFRPPPRNAEWIRTGFEIDKHTKGGFRITCRYEGERTNHAIARQRKQIEEVCFEGEEMGFGVMQGESTILVMRTVKEPKPRLVLNLRAKQLDFHFGIFFGAQRGQGRRDFIFRIPLAQLRSLREARDDDGRVCFVVPLDTPPLAFRKTANVWATHDSKVDTWDERQAWYRQVSIDSNAASAALRPAQVQNDECLIDIGRWLAYRFVCDAATSQEILAQFREALAKHNIDVRPGKVECISNEQLSHWSWLGCSGQAVTSSTPSAMDQMSGEAIYLPFDVRYQLEACISQGFLHESNLSIAWAKCLLDMDQSHELKDAQHKHRRATRLLEKVLESKQRFYDPMDIFKLQGQVSLARNKIPRYCTMVRSATVTPTTIYFHSPSMDTSNRVVRQFRQYEDRFLRVKFRDESHKGTIMSFDDDTTMELFTRVKRTMKNGIVVGDRHYEFLAYGNSQFREHGAYFFASTSSLTADMIREWMGDFQKIRVVAKYASRVGQCFSTTRAMANGVTVRKIEDLERNGYCFSDGVGKISMFLAQMTAQEMGFPSSPNDCPSVYQFRLGGLKGVLAIDPELKGPVIEVRPSQEKFPATHRGLEICRVSQFATAYLNQQIVLVLSALGVPDEVFLEMLRNMLRRLEQAMTDESVALELLQRNIDLNQSTVEIASMILDGFMANRDPFVITCLRLWRSWSIKYLKEKAKIFVEQGAFVLGCVDETGTLKGHSNTAPASDTTHNVDELPEIFLQIPDPEAKGSFKVIEGLCSLARNPSLHPGDIRIVRAVDNPKLRHLRNCVVLPQTGDRDLASMCSGGDLDGDDYLVIWDPKLLPKEWNHTPMDYTAPPPVVSEGPITVDAMTSFFVTHMKNDNLGRIATAHRYWADRLEEGVKHEKCLELAALHSKAVDYAKTGVPAEMPKELKVTAWPHWAVKKVGRWYRSLKILGKLYDAVACGGSGKRIIPPWPFGAFEGIVGGIGGGW